MGKTLRIMAAGDSITAGTNDPPGGYRGVLQNLLRQQQVNFEFVGGVRDVNGAAEGGHEGYPGWSIRHLHHGHSDAYGTSAGIAESVQRHRPDVMLLLIGTNDMYFADPGVASEEVRCLLLTLQETAPQMHTILGSILPVIPGPKPWDATVPDSVVERVRSYNLCLAGLVAGRRKAGERISFVDHYPLVRGAEDLLPDGVHPTRQVFERMAWVWLAGMKACGVI